VVVWGGLAELPAHLVAVAVDVAVFAGSVLRPSRGVVGEVVVDELASVAPRGFLL
jgi:hypothetical protein